MHSDKRQVVLLKSKLTLNRFYTLASPERGWKNAEEIEDFPDDVSLGLAPRSLPLRAPRPLPRRQGAAGRPDGDGRRGARHPRPSPLRIAEPALHPSGALPGHRPSRVQGVFDQAVRDGEHSADARQYDE